MTTPGLRLTEAETSMLDGTRGEGVALAMRVVVAVAEIMGAERLIDIESAHVDGCLYHGQAGLDFAERLAELGAGCAVRTTLNVSSLDLLHPKLVRHPQTAEARRLMDAYVALGAEPTWTCAPYQQSLTAHRPAMGANIAWAESNALCFANSVLGARTERYGDFLDIAAAIVGRVPFAGLHTDAARVPTRGIDLAALDPAWFARDDFWPTLGKLLGEIAGTEVTIMLGIPAGVPLEIITEDRLKALSATSASAGGVALFHLAGVTPEARVHPEWAEELAGDPGRTVRIDDAAIAAARDSLSTATGDSLDAVSLGTPHFSLSEFRELDVVLAGLFSDGPARFAADTYVSTSRSVAAEASEAGLLNRFASAGGRIVTDTCTYITPVLRDDTEVVMTNSGKWAWYAPGNLGIDVVLGSLGECLASAQQGRVVRTPLSAAPAGSGVRS